MFERQQGISAGSGLAAGHAPVRSRGSVNAAVNLVTPPFFHLCRADVGMIVIESDFYPPCPASNLMCNGHGCSRDRHAAMTDRSPRSQHPRRVVRRRSAVAVVESADASRSVTFPPSFCTGRRLWKSLGLGTVVVDVAACVPESRRQIAMNGPKADLIAPFMATISHSRRRSAND